MVKLGPSSNVHMHAKHLPEIVQHLTIATPLRPTTRCQRSKEYMIPFCEHNQKKH